VARFFSNAAPPFLRFYCAGFDRVARRLGVEGVPSLPALVLGDLALVPEVPEVLGISAAEVEAWRPAGRAAFRPGTRLRCCGPIFARLDLPLPERVSAFLERPGPKVYVAVSSSPPELVRRAVEALRPLGVQVLVAATVHDLRDLEGDRVLVEGVLPSHLVMSRVDLAITAGGQGSVQTAMAGGAPVLGFPLQPEQDLNLVLLERLGAARRVDPRSPTSRVGAIAREMLAGDSYRRAARRIQGIYQAVDGPGNAAEAILELASGSAPVPQGKRMAG
jgi:UDP:flavonoid glycosyltransferase YjiC (YdhE family)